MSYLAVRQPGRVAAVQDGAAYLLVTVVGATVLAVSAYYLWLLALQVGMPRWLAWSLPVTLDAGATGATLCWLGARGATARTWGRGLALGALLGSVAGNALSHLIEAGLVVVTPALVIAIAVVYPAMLFVMVHLVLVMRAERCALEVSAIDQEPTDDASPATEDASLSDQRPAVEPVVMHQPVVVEAAAEASEPPVVKRRRSTAAQRRRWIAAQLDAGEPMAGLGGRVERRWGSRNGAREVAQVVAVRAAAGTGAAGVA